MNIDFDYIRNFDRTSDCVYAAADVEVSIDGPGQTDVVKKQEQNGVLSVDYLPVLPGEYTISVKSHGKHIHGSPFGAKVSGCLFIVFIFVSLTRRTSKSIKARHYRHSCGAL